MASKVTQDGYTIMRGLAMDFNTDKKTYSINDQYMFGPSIMVCPVTEYMYNRPPEKSIPVAADHFETKSGKQGLEAKYYKDTEYKLLGLEKIDKAIDINWYETGRPDYVTDSSLSIEWNGKIIPSETGKHQFHIKCYGPKKLFIDGKELKYTYQSVEVYTETIELVAGQEYDFRLETENTNPGAFHVELYWKTPKIFAKENIKEDREQTRNVYLPANTKWIDFWTGETIDGGQTISSDAPIDKIPLFVVAGSIIPMGPFVQYANEKPDAPYEIRIYPGADGKFTLYEDENDNYNYEKGMFAEVDFMWADTQKQLIISDRKGTFPGILQEREMKFVIVDSKNGGGIKNSDKLDKVVIYNGTEQVIQF